MRILPDNMRAKSIAVALGLLLGAIYFLFCGILWFGQEVDSLGTGRNLSIGVFLVSFFCSWRLTRTLTSGWFYWLTGSCLGPLYTLRLPGSFGIVLDCMITHIFGAFLANYLVSKRRSFV